MFNIGDKVSVLDDTIDGVVVGINNTEISVETNNGFLMTYFINELIKQNNTSELEQLNSIKNLSLIISEKQDPIKRIFVKEKRSKKDDFVLEVDLHIEKLVSSKRGMSNYDILNIQMETAKRQIDFAIKNRIPKMVLIHGVGEGVLKAELDFLLGRYENIKHQEANFQKYGQGATEIYFIKNKSF